MIIWHELFSIGHFLLVPAFKFHRPFLKSWGWIKILIIWAAVNSKGFKGATMLLVVSFISFFLFCHRTGQCIVRILNWKDSFILSTNVSPAFSVFKLWYFIVTVRTQDSFRSDFMKKRDYLGWVKSKDVYRKAPLFLLTVGLFPRPSQPNFSKNPETKSVWHFPFLNACNFAQLTESKGKKFLKSWCLWYWGKIDSLFKFPTKKQWSNFHLELWMIETDVLLTCPCICKS